ncbi:MAG: type III-B CRISPR module-associated protein Cmr5 [Candidatus Omnitrophica bacterium]|nr:type III-B CRISPR module-associated protein Cmr5 [Candidatus Omnitrophota bacterium]
MTLKTLEQKRAEFAFQKVNEVKKEDKKGEYKSLVRGFPAMILQNGLGQALAFLRAKGEKHHQWLYGQINEWLKVSNNGDENFDVLQNIMNRDSSIYRLYTKQTLAFLVWLRKFAEAEIEKDKDEEQ